MSRTTKDDGNYIPGFDDFIRLFKEEEVPGRFCGNCRAKGNSVKLMACGGCSRSVLKIFYCSQNCQKADWRKHKEICRMNRDKNKGLKLRDPKGYLRGIREVAALWNTYRIALDWAAAQAFITNPQYDPATTCLEIGISEMEPGVINLPFIPGRFRFVPLTPEEILGIKTPQNKKIWGYHKFSTSMVEEIRAVTLDGLPEFCSFFVDPSPQWPYVLIEALSERERSVWKAWIKTMVILGTVQNFNGPGKPLEPFKCSMVTGEWKMEMRDLQNWHKTFEKLR